MLQITRTSAGLRRGRDRLRRRRRHRRQSPHRPGHQRRAARSRPDAQSRQGFQGARAALPGGPPRRRRRTPNSISAASSAFGYFAAPNGDWDLPGEPYTVATAASFSWFRSRIIGGRTNHYGRISLRFSDYDFQPEDGLGVDWPITYDEMSPYYDKAEGFIGVTGTKEGLRTAPDGNFLPPIRAAGARVLIQQACKKLGIPCIPSRMAMLTKSHQRPRRLPLLRPMRPRMPDGIELHLEPGHDLPRHEDRQAHPVHRRHGARVITNGDGKATAVSYVDKATRRKSRCAAARWWWRPAPANRRGCC